MVGNSGFIGYVPPSSTDPSSTVIIDIAESLDISGFTPHLTVSAIPPIDVSGFTAHLTVSSIAPVGVSGLVNVSGLQADVGNLSGLNASGFGLANASLNTIGTYLNDVEGSLAAIELNGDHMEVLNASGFTINTSGHGYGNARLNAINTNVAKIINEQEKVDVSVSGWDSSVTGITQSIIYGTGAGGALIPITSDDQGRLNMSTSGSTPIEITSPVLPLDSEFLSTATFTLDANGDIPASNVAVIAAQGASTRILIYGMTISSTGTSGRGYWYLTDGNFVNDGSPYNKASGAIDAAQGVAVTNLAFPYPIAIRANSAVNISVTEAVTQAYLVGTVYYKIADYN